MIFVFGEWSETKIDSTNREVLEFEIVTYFVSLVVLCDNNTHSRNFHLETGNDPGHVNRSKPKLNYPAHFDRL